MKKTLIKASMFGLTTILLGSPLVATAWDHSTGSQGPDGKGWASIVSGTATPPLNYPDAECGIGFHQSPIAVNLTTQTLTSNPVIGSTNESNPVATIEKFSSPLDVKYVSSTSSGEGSAVSTDTSNAYVFENSGHAAQVAFSKGYTGKLLVGEDAYQLQQFHFHTPSEHIIVTTENPTGKQYAGELHFVNQRADGKLAVFTVFLDDTGNGSNDTLDEIVKYVPQASGSNDTASFCTSASTDSKGNPIPCVGLKLNPMDLLPKDRTTIYSYAGSLTTPPCSEGVNWYILSEPLQVSPGEIAVLQGIYFASNRLIQNTNPTGTNITRQIEIHNNLMLKSVQNFPGSGGKIAWKND